MRYDIGITVDYESHAEAEAIGEDLQRIIGSWPGTHRVRVTVNESEDES
jgi:hypothetical protein